MAFTVTNLSKRHGKNWVFRDVSFKIGEGEIVGLFGAFGSGKTTLLNVLGGSIKPDGGSVEGEAHFPAVAEVSFWSSVLGKGRLSDPRKAVDAANAFRSGTILLDEVFSSLDRLTKQTEFRRLRQAVNERNLSAILATADYNDVLEFADRVLVIVNGYIVQDDTPENIYNLPATKTVAQLTGRCNLIAARRLTSNKTDLPEFITLEGEHRLFAEKSDNNSLGSINQNVALAIRPEQISLSFGASFPEDNLLKGTVIAYKFLGPQTVIELDANGLTLEAAVPRLVGLKTGDECMVGLPPDRIRILKD